MKRLLTTIMAMVFLFGITCTTLATEKVPDTTRGNLHSAKIEAAKQLEQSGVVKEIDQKVKEYYAEHKGQLIDVEKVNFSDPKESKAFYNSLDDRIHSNGIVINRTAAQGTNSISFANFSDADIILVNDGECPYGYYRHGGTYDEDEGEFVSAQISDGGNGTGVIWEPKSWYTNHYDEAIGLGVDYNVGGWEGPLVPGWIMSLLRDQLGEPYAFSGKTSSWYCTKLPWYGYSNYGAVDIDDNGGTYCLPDDIYYSDYTYLFAYGD